MEFLLWSASKLAGKPRPSGLDTLPAMFSANHGLRTFLDSLDALASASDGGLCRSSEIIEIAQRAESELDLYFGIGNWYSSALVRLVAQALRDYPTEILCGVVGKIAALLRSAGESDARRFSAP